MVSNESKFFAFLGVFLTIVGFLLALLVKRKDQYVMYYGKQGLILFFFGLVLWLINFILLETDIIDSDVLGSGLAILFIVIWTYSWINALSGTESPVPLIGKLGERLKI